MVGVISGCAGLRIPEAGQPAASFVLVEQPAALVQADRPEERDDGEVPELEPDLSRITRVMELMGDPQNSYRSIRIAVEVRLEAALPVAVSQRGRAGGDGVARRPRARDRLRPCVEPGAGRARRWR